MTGRESVVGCLMCAGVALTQFTCIKSRRQRKRQLWSRKYLGDAAQRELLHEVDDVRLLQEPVLEVLDSHRKGGRVQQNLAVGGQVGNEPLNDWLELWG